VGGTLEPAVRRPGEVVRAARLRSGLTLAELGNRTGYSAAQVSRYERGVTPLRDVSVLRRFARALAISPGELGLAETGPGGGSGRALIAVASGVPSRVVPSRVAGEPGGRDEDVRRRQLLAALGAAAAGAAGSRRGWQPGRRCGSTGRAKRRRGRGTAGQPGAGRDAWPRAGACTGVGGRCARWTGRCSGRLP
jgi:transcriptional regulator with XRE-family HTH domain